MFEVVDTNLWWEIVREVVNLWDNGLGNGNRLLIEVVVGLVVVIGLVVINMGGINDDLLLRRDNENKDVDKDEEEGIGAKQWFLDILVVLVIEWVGDPFLFAVVTSFSWVASFVLVWQKISQFLTILKYKW